MSGMSLNRSIRQTRPKLLPFDTDAHSLRNAPGFLSVTLRQRVESFTHEEEALVEQHESQSSSPYQNRPLQRAPPQKRVTFVVDARSSRNEDNSSIRKDSFVYGQLPMEEQQSQSSSVYQKQRPIRQALRSKQSTSVIDARSSRDEETTAVHKENVAY
ncbi:hypothetical protein ANCCAN_15916 [Ancylostoma caninum]|uniref:Uncharacterized protein n=1 Tax=Ancylostoma caninum TaxID=29170 RepID=A0A368G1D5_ANCCA|nr:hypothetical protein ANCCAN_15916 [Ancylostoma caninum]